MTKLHRNDETTEVLVEDLAGFVYAPNPNQGKQQPTQGNKSPIVKGKSAGKKSKLTAGAVSHKTAISLAVNAKSTKSKKGDK